MIPTHRTLIFVTALAAVALFIAAALFDPLPGDPTITNGIQRWDFPGMLPFMEGISTLSDGVVLSIIGLSIAAYWWATDFRAAAYAAAATLLVMPTGWLLKLLVDRPRPPADALIRITNDFSGLGFPSGHAFQSTLLIGLFIGVAALRVQPGRLRLATMALLALLIVAIGFSRIYLGAHWPSDVLGGYLAATPIVLIIHARLSMALRPSHL